jgi:hypothetical protein
MKYKLNDLVIYRGKTYTFPGKICAITTDGQYVVRAEPTNQNGYFAGMKHIFGEAQLEPWNPQEDNDE